MTALLRRVLSLSAVAALALSLIAPAASAERSEDDAAALAQEQLSRDLGEQLGERAAGAWIDPGTGALTVNVTDDDAAGQVRAAGAQAGVVTHSLADLERAQAALDPALAPDGVAWAVDVPTNSLVISVPKDVSGKRLDAFVAHARTLGVPVTVETVPAAPEQAALYGGEAISNGGTRCSAGFVAHNGRGDWYLLTAGHCTNLGGTWYSDGRTLGPVAATNWDGSDFGAVVLLRPGAIDVPGAVWLYGSGVRDVERVSRVPVGHRVCKSGSTTGLTCGTVQRYNATVRYNDGAVVYGLTQANVCIQPGDSGGALFFGRSAQGIVSGGSIGSCAQAGFTSYFQPVDEALRRYGLTLH